MLSYQCASSEIAVQDEPVGVPDFNTNFGKTHLCNTSTPSEKRKEVLPEWHDTLIETRMQLVS